MSQSIIEKVWRAGQESEKPFGPVLFRETVFLATGFLPDEIEPRELLAKAAEIAENRGFRKTREDILSLMPELPDSPV